MTDDDFGIPPLTAEDFGIPPFAPGEYLEALRWDGVKRLDTWLQVYLEVVDSDYVRAVSRKWLIAAVARAMVSPVKADCVLILEGKQGMGKSTALSILGGEWFDDTNFVLGDKDGYQQMQGKWMVELAELDSFNKAESTKAKQFFSSQTDRYRPSYGRRAQDYPRQCVFAGTTNQDNYLKDATGNRRYWPVRCEQINHAALVRDRDQIWAEAVHAWRAGVLWWVDTDELHLFESEQEARFDADVWQTLITDWLVDNPQKIYVTGAEVMAEALNMEPAHMKRPEQTRVGLVMTALKWHKRKRTLTFEGGRKEERWCYVRPGHC